MAALSVTPGFERKSLPRSGGRGGSQPPLSARLPPRTDPQQLLPHEETVRAVYKKHAQTFFEEIKQGFLKEAATLRKQAQKALTRTVSTAWDSEDQEGGAQLPGIHAQVIALQRQVAALQGAAEGGPSRDGASGSADHLAGLHARMEKQQEDLRNLSKHVQHELVSAKKATLTPMWKERALQEIAQGELRGVCAEEVSKSFKELAASFDDRQVDAAIRRLCEAGPMPWETALRAEMGQATGRLAGQIRELSLRADEGSHARAVLLERFAGLEEKHRADWRKLEGLSADHGEKLDAFKVGLQALRDENTASAARIWTRLEGVDQRLQTVEAMAEGRCNKLEATAVALRDDLADEVAVRAAEVERLEATLASQDIRADAAFGELRSLAQATQAASTATSGIAATASHEAAEAAGIARELRQVVEALSARAEAVVGGAAAASSKAAVGRGLAAAAVEETGADSIYAAAKLRAHLEFVETRVTELHRHAEGVSDEIGSHARRLSDTSVQHTARLEALEGRLQELHRLHTGLSGDLGLHVQKVGAASAQHAVRGQELEDRFRGLQLYTEGLRSEIGNRIQNITEDLRRDTCLLAGRAEALEARQERARHGASILGTRVDMLEARQEALRNEAGEGLGARVRALEARHESVREDVAALAERAALLEGSRGGRAAARYDRLRAGGTPTPDAAGGGAGPLPASVRSSAGVPPAVALKPPPPKLAARQVAEPKLAAEPVGRPTGRNPPATARQRIAGQLSQAVVTGELDRVLKYVLAEAELEKPPSPQAGLQPEAGREAKERPPEASPEEGPWDDEPGLDEEVACANWPNPDGKEADANRFTPAATVSRLSMSSEGEQALADEMARQLVGMDISPQVLSEDVAQQLLSAVDVDISPKAMRPTSPDDAGQASIGEACAGSAAEEPEVDRVRPGSAIHSLADVQSEAQDGQDRSTAASFSRESMCSFSIADAITGRLFLSPTSIG